MSGPSEQMTRAEKEAVAHLRTVSGQHPECDHFADLPSKVIRTVQEGRTIKRERKCGYCKGKFWTRENTEVEIERERRGHTGRIMDQAAEIDELKIVLDGMKDGLQGVMDFK